MPFSIYCLLLITLPVLNLCSTVTKSITLTQVDTASNVITNGWDIITSSNSNWNIHISMNDSWNFLSNQQSIITLKTYINPTTTTNKDLIFIFAQDTNKYITSTIKTNNNSVHNGIFPHCSTNNAENTLMANGNINTLLNDGVESRNRKYKLTQGLNYDNIPADSDTYTPNTSPFTIQLINNPMGQWSKYVYSNQQCKFESFSSEYPIDIYISAADIGQIVSINKFEITFAYSDADVSDTETTIQTNENDETKSENDTDSFIQSNTRFIIMILAVITVILLIICIGLIFMVRKQSIDNKKAENKLDVNNINIEMEGNKDNVGITAAELVLHTTTFKKEEASKNYSYESRTSVGSQITDFNYEFCANVAIAQDAHMTQNVVNVNMDNDNEGYLDNSDDDDVILDMIATAGQ